MTGTNEGFGAEFPQFVQGGIGESGAGDEFVAPEGGLGGGVDGGDGGGLGDGPVEEATCRGNAHEGDDAGAAGGFTHEGDIGGVAAESGDVVFDPVEGEELVEDGGVGDAVVAEAGEVKVAEGAEPEVQGDIDHVHGLDEVVAAEDLLVAGSVDEGAAVEVDDDGEGAVVVGTDNVEVEAVFAATDAVAGGEGGLGGDGTVFGAVFDAVPSWCRVRGAESVVAGGGVAVGDAAPGAERPGDGESKAANSAGGGGDYEIVGDLVAGCVIGGFDAGVRRACGFCRVACRSIGGMGAEGVPHISLE